MKILGTIGLAAVLAGALAGTTLAAASVGLGTAGTFAVLAGSTITNTGATTITGDVGLHPGTSVTGFSTVTLNGTEHDTDAVAEQAKTDLTTAYDDAAGQTPDTVVSADLGGQTLTAGVYGSTTSLGLTGTLTLDAEGNPDAVFIFQAGSTLTTAPDSVVELIGEASACNVYWQVGTSATLGTSTDFKGTILALTSITLNTNATIEGRALARTGAVTLDTNVIDSSACAASAPGATPTPGVTASPSPVATPGATATPSPVATIPPTDTTPSTPAAVTDPVPVASLLFLVVVGFGFLAAIRLVALRSRPRT